MVLVPCVLNVAPIPVFPYERNFCIEVSDLTFTGFVHQRSIEEYYNASYLKAEYIKEEGGIIKLLTEAEFVQSAGGRLLVPKKWFEENCKPTREFHI